jgi:hypothetical protein
MGSLALLPVTGSAVARRRRRIGGLVASSTLHTILALIIILTKERPVPDSDSPPDNRAVDVSLVAPVIPAAAARRPEEGIARAERVEYATAPIDPAVKAVSNSANVTTPPTDEVSVSAPVPLSVERLQHALELRRRGFKGPGYTADNLTVAVVARLVQSGFARVIIGRPPFDDSTYEVNWADGQGERFETLGDTAWMSNVVARAVRLPNALNGRLLEGLRRAAGLSTAGTRAYLFLAQDLDLAVLAQQIAACEAAGRPLDDVRRTIGRFAITGASRIDYVVDALELHGGQTLQTR